MWPTGDYRRGRSAGQPSWSTYRNRASPVSPMAIRRRYARSRSSCSRSWTANGGRSPDAAVIPSVARSRVNSARACCYCARIPVHAGIADL